MFGNDRRRYISVMPIKTGEPGEALKTFCRTLTAVVESELALQHFDAATAAAEDALHHVTAKDQRLLFIQWEERIAQKK